VRGDFGVFDRTNLLATFGDDDAADEHRRQLLEVDMPEHMRCSPYDELEVFEIPDDLDYPTWNRILTKLRASRNQDLAVMRYLHRLQLAQRERAMGDARDSASVRQR